MKKLVVIIFIISLSSLYAGDVGLGIILGEPTGLSLKVWQSESVAYDAAAAWSMGDEGALHIHADILHHNYSMISNNFPIHYGIGARARLEDDPKIGIRIPVGMGYRFQQMPIGTFIELVPVLDLMPETSFGFNGAIGFRYYF